MHDEDVALNMSDTIREELFGESKSDRHPQSPERMHKIKVKDNSVAVLAAALVLVFSGCAESQPQDKNKSSGGTGVASYLLAKQLSDSSAERAAAPKSGFFGGAKGSTS